MIIAIVILSYLLAGFVVQFAATISTGEVGTFDVEISIVLGWPIVIGVFLIEFVRGAR